MIVIAMTSWKKRIDNVKNIIDSILKNTILPDRIYLTLSSDEFPQKEKELPTDLVELFNSNETLILNWVKENTKSMKKVFPILQYLNDDDLIIDADDDILFPKDLIESRLKDFKNNNSSYCITSNNNTSIGFNRQMKIVQATSLFQKKMLNNWEKFVTDNIIKTYNDDRTYLTLLWLNGFLNKGCSKWTIQELLEKYDMKLDNGMKENHIHLIGKKYDVVANNEWKKQTNNDIIKSFGILK